MNETGCNSREYGTGLRNSRQLIRALFAELKNYIGLRCVREQFYGGRGAKPEAAGSKPSNHLVRSLEAAGTKLGRHDVIRSLSQMVRR